MRLTQQTNYALRLLQFAALRAPDLVQVGEVARAHGISRSHLVQIAHRLGREGLLETVQGRGGGVRLAKPAEAISVGAVVRLTEAPLALVECFEPETNTCPLIGACVLSSAFGRALAAFLAELDKVSIAQIAANRGALLSRLSLPGEGTAA